MDVNQVSSELYSEYDYISSSKPIANKANIVSEFKFNYPPGTPERDGDGDYIVYRKKAGEKYGTIEIEHSGRTNLELVGLQIWRGALLLADWLMYHGNKMSKDFYILELGSGVGFSSIVASMFAPVICTDVNKGGLFNIINGNIARNKKLSKHPIQLHSLDFFAQCLPQEIVALLPKTPIIITADVIYDDVITAAFVRTIQHLLSNPPKKELYIALEIRYVFTVADCDIAAPCYDFFIESINNSQDLTYEEVPIDFPQYFKYDRVKQLTFLKITTTKFDSKESQLNLLENTST